MIDTLVKGATVETLINSPLPPFQIIEDFCKLGFPHYIGAVDKMHIQRGPPKGQVVEYINGKQTFSVLLQGATDHTRRFIDIEVSYSRRNHNAYVFEYSTLCIAMDAGVFMPFNRTTTVGSVIITSSSLMQHTPYMNDS